MREVLADDELTGWRIDKQRHWTAMIRGLAAYMDWKTRCTRPTWDLLAEWGAAHGRPRRGRRNARQLHKSTVARCLRWLAARGYLGVVESGSTPDFRPMALRTAADGNLAAVYVLTTHGRNTINRARTPRIDADQSGIATPSVSRTFIEAPRTRARARRGAKIKGNNDRPPGGLPLLPRDGAPRTAAGRPEKRSEDERAARLVQDLAAVLGGLSPAHVAHLVRPQLAAGWTPADVVYALDHQPGGRPYGFTAAVRHPAAWARARLAAWLDPAGAPLASASQVRVAAAAATAAEQAAWRAELAAARASRVDPAGPAARARAMLAARGGRVAQDLARWQLQRRPGPAAGNQSRNAPQSPLRAGPGPVRPNIPADAPAASPAPRAPEPPAWRTRAAAAAVPDRQAQPDRNSSMTTSGRTAGSRPSASACPAPANR